MKTRLHVLYFLLKLRLRCMNRVLCRGFCLIFRIITLFYYHKAKSFALLCLGWYHSWAFPHYMLDESLVCSGLRVSGKASYRHDKQICSSCIPDSCPSWLLFYWYPKRHREKAFFHPILNCRFEYPLEAKFISTSLSLSGMKLGEILYKQFYCIYHSYCSIDLRNGERLVFHSTKCSLWMHSNS